jgi:hypothetical protein
MEKLTVIVFVPNPEVIVAPGGTFQLYTMALFMIPTV